MDHSRRNCPPDHFFSTTEQADLNLSRFPDFQIVEIHCIRDYLVRRLRGICDQLEREAFETLSLESFRSLSESDFRAGSDTGIYLFTEDGKYDQDAHIEHLMSLGLNYLRQIFEAHGDEKRALFMRCCPSADYSEVNHLEINFLSAAFHRLGRNPAHKESLDESDSPCVFEINASEELGIPDAWQWAHPQGPPEELLDVWLGGLRGWGYVFWDESRLRDIGILNRDVEDVRNIAFNENSSSLLPNVQERLLDEHNMEETYQYMVGLLAEP